VPGWGAREGLRGRPAKRRSSAPRSPSHRANSHHSGRKGAS
jgi:hypothetical protein